MVGLLMSPSDGYSKRPQLVQAVFRFQCMYCRDGCEKRMRDVLMRFCVLLQKELVCHLDGLVRVTFHIRAKGVKRVVVRAQQHLSKAAP